MNTVLLAYCRVGDLWKAEDLLRDMRNNMGMIPDVVCYTTLIDGYAKVEDFARCWEIYTECMQKDKPGQDIDEQMMSYMIRLCSKSKDPQKALRMFNEMQLDGFVEHSKPFNSIMMACASHFMYAPRTIEYWHQMHMKDVEPDNVTYVAVLKACAQIGDIQTAYDVLQELKIKNGTMNNHIFNQLIRVYAGAIKEPECSDEKVDRYCGDAWALYQQMQEMPESEVSVQVLNSLIHLYAGAIRPHEIESKVLPQYALHKIAYDENTYAHLSKLYLYMRDLDKVIDLFDKSQAAGLKPIRSLVSSYLEAGLRK